MLTSHLEPVLGRALGREPAYEPRGYVTPMSVGGVLLIVLGLAGIFARTLIPKHRGLWMFGSLFALSAGLSFTATAVVKEAVGREMVVRTGTLDTAEAQFESSLDELHLDPFARVQLLGRLAQREAARYGLGKVA